MYLSLPVKKVIYLVLVSKSYFILTFSLKISLLYSCRQYFEYVSCPAISILHTTFFLSEYSGLMLNIKINNNIKLIINNFLICGVFLYKNTSR